MELLLSKGIPPSIDLTDGGVFQDGKYNSNLVLDQIPNILPWSDDGEIRDITCRRRSIMFRNIREEYENIVNNGFNSAIADSIHREMELLEKHMLSDDNVENDIMDKCSHFNFYIDNDKVFCTAKSITSHRMDDDISYSISNTKIFTSTYSSSWHRYTVNTINSDMTTSVTYRTNNKTSTYNKMLDSERLDVTPSEFRGVKLTKEELNDEVLITSQDPNTLYLKIKKLIFLKKVKTILESEEYKKYNGAIESHCKCCNKPIVRIYKNNQYGDNSMYCATCKVEQGEMKLKPGRDPWDTIGRRSYGCNDFIDMHNDITLASTIEHVSCIQGDDYFEQHCYSDGGIYLIRIPRDSHELQVSLIDKEFDSDDTDEIRRRLSEPDLIYPSTRHQVPSIFQKEYDIFIASINEIIIDVGDNVTRIESNDDLQQTGINSRVTDNNILNQWNTRNLFDFSDDIIMAT